MFAKMRTNFIAVFLFSCVSLHCNLNKKTNSNVFFYNEDAGISSLDPAFSKDQSTIWASLQLFNGLVQLDSFLHVFPCIAKSWEITEGGKSYIFHLRADVFFHENETVFGKQKTRLATAHDFVYSFKRLVSPTTASPGAWIFNGKISYPDSAFNAPNDSTFVLRLINPFPPMLGLLSMPYCAVVPHEAIEKYSKDIGSHPIGTGPFRLRAWHEGIKLLLERNPSYFEKDEQGKSLPYLDGVEVGFIESKQAAFFEFVKGHLDFMNGLESSFKDEILTHKGRLRQQYQGKFKLVTGPYLNTEYLAFMLDSAHLSDPNNPLRHLKMRQAIAYAIDRKKMLQYLRNNIGSGAVRGFVPAGLPGMATEIYAYNPVKARKLLQEVGYDQKTMPPIVINTTKSYVDLTVYIQNQLSAVGIKSSIEVSPGPTHREMVSKGGLSFFRGSWIADYPDAENYLSLFYGKNAAPNGPNTTRYSKATFDQLYTRAMQQPNAETRSQLYTQLDSLMMQDCPVVVLFYDRSIRLVQNTIAGLETNPMNNLVLKRVRKVR